MDRTEKVTVTTLVADGVLWAVIWVCVAFIGLNLLGNLAAHIRKSCLKDAVECAAVVQEWETRR